MEKKEDKPIAIGAESVPFKFELSQLVTMRISEEWGEVQARAQYANGENQYLIHYQAADGRATTEWFGESMLIAMEDDRYPGCPVFACVDLPEGAVLEDDKEECSSDGEARCGVNAGGFFITGRWATAVSCDLTTVIHTHRVPWIQTEAHLLAQARGF
ncbi:hypothetical protein [Escherichia coli]|uniref:hypothetical protein n=2 Tax=Escherichia coli TaxID=562 RepID=UPI00201AD5F3|nr:hypothetical protein [Escherichia coli]